MIHPAVSESLLCASDDEHPLRVDSSICLVRHSVRFTYQDEKYAVLKVLNQGDPALFAKTHEKSFCARRKLACALRACN